MCHILAVINSVAMNIEVHISFQAMFFSGYMPKSGITGSSIFSFLRSLCTVLHSGCTSFILTDSAAMFPYLHTFPSFVCGFFDVSHSDQCEVISNCSFDLHFSNN